MQAGIALAWATAARGGSEEALSPQANPGAIPNANYAGFGWSGQLAFGWDAWVGDQSSFGILARLQYGGAGRRPSKRLGRRQLGHELHLPSTPRHLHLSVTLCCSACAARASDCANSNWRKSARFRIEHWFDQLSVPRLPIRGLQSVRDAVAV
jgi:hypothetical protein